MPLSSVAAIETFVQRGVGWWNCQDWGRLHLVGAGVTDYLHSQTSQDMKAVAVGAGCETTFMTATAHLIDQVTAYRQDAEDWLLITAPGSRLTLGGWIQRLLMFTRTSRLLDVTEQTAMVRVAGGESAAWLQSQGLPLPEGQHHHLQSAWQGIPLHVAQGCGLGIPGYTLWTETTEADVWHNLLAGIPRVTDQEWQALTVVRGRPCWGAEITEDYNPLEAGLWSAISLSKGCYIGQEVLAKQVTYQRLRQRLWGVHLEQVVAAGSPIVIDEHKEGVLTRCVVLDDGIYGLGYVRTKTGEEGRRVQVGDTWATLHERPELTFAQQAPLPRSTTQTVSQSN
ncbi:MAG: folate-binding protein YgfZ [Synechococcales cyanobacterium]